MSPSCSSEDNLSYSIFCFPKQPSILINLDLIWIDRLLELQRASSPPNNHLSLTSDITELAAMVLVKSFVLTGLAAVVAAKSAVLDLIPSNFDDVVLKSGKPTLVEFFAPWCGHCKNLAPVYEELAGVFASTKDVQIAKVDADAEKSLGKRFGVQGFPTLKFFDGKSDKPTDYNGGRDLDSLTNFITEKTGVKAKRKLEMPSPVEMLTDKTFKETIGSDKNALVAFTAPWCGRKLIAFFQPSFDVKLT